MSLAQLGMTLNATQPARGIEQGFQGASTLSLTNEHTYPKDHSLPKALLEVFFAILRGERHTASTGQALSNLCISENPRKEGRAIVSVC